MDTQEEHNDEATKPGQYLAYQREKQGVTVEDIASKLHLAVSIIHAIEEDDYDKLPELVYVRGYIRSYCRLLNMDPIPVLDMYTANLPKEEDYLLEDLSPNSPVNENRQRLIMIWGSIIVITILLVFMISWWQQNQLPTSPVHHSTIIHDNPIVQPDTSNPNISTTATTTTTTQETILVDINDPNISTTTITQEAIINDPNISTTTITQETPGIDDPNISTTTIPEDKIPDETQPDGSQTPNDVNRDIGENSDNTTGLPQLVTLVIMTSEDSWARVRDGSGELIVHRILPANYNKIFMVNLPLNFKFGNAHKVNIMINGNNYDFSSYITPNSTATFEVTELP